MNKKNYTAKEKLLKARMQHHIRMYLNGSIPKDVALEKIREWVVKTTNKFPYEFSVKKNKILYNFVIE